MPSEKKHKEILSGINPVFEALKAKKRKIYKLFHYAGRTNRRIDMIIEYAAGMHIQIVPCDRKRLAAITKTQDHQGIAAEVSVFHTCRLDYLLSQASEPFFLLADSITDPQNLGSLIRSSICGGVNGIIVPKDRAAPLSAAVSRASAGAMEHASICQVTNLASCIQQLKKNGIWVIGLDRDAPDSIYEIDFTGSCALVVGGEDTGIRPLVAKRCDLLCSIPQEKEFSSLNAAIAGAIAIYEIVRQKKKR